MQPSIPPNPAFQSVVQPVFAPNEFLVNLALLLFILLCFAGLSILIYLFIFLREIKERTITALIVAENNAADWSFVGTGLLSIFKLINLKKKKGVMSILKDLL